MSISKRLAVYRAAAPTIEEIEQDEDLPTNPGDEPDDEEENDMTDTNKDNLAAVADAKQQGFAEANARFNTVIASEHYAGREALAKTLLANDKLGADDVIAALAAAPKPAAATTELTEAQKKTAEAAARAEMRSAIGDTTNSDVDANADDADKKKAKAKAISESWDKVYADLNPKKVS